MKAFKHSYHYFFAAFLGMLLYSCQGSLDTDISELFEQMPSNSSASNTPSSKGANGSQNGKNLTEVANKLIGTWMCIKQTTTEDGESDSYTYDEDDGIYLTFNPDFTVESSQRRIFEVESIDGAWSLKSATELVLKRDHIFKIVQLNSSTLVLRWEDIDEDFSLIETTTFRRVN